MKKNKIVSLLMVLVLLFINACGNAGLDTSKFPNGEVKVYNWGEYIDPDVITDFENKYGIKVIYDMYETNEEMYPIIELGSVKYDCICPSEYMVEKLINNDLLMELDYSLIPNAKEKVGEKYWIFNENVDKDRIHAVPYMAGSVGILYNKTLLDEKGLPYPKHWEDLWNEEYKGEILMQDSIRDCMMVSLIKNGFSSNTKDENEIKIAAEDLINQKPLVQAYVVDQARDKMISGEAMIAVMYSGEYLYVSNETGDNYEYEYILPNEGTNIWIDSWCIPKNCENVENAYRWLNYMCDVDVAVKNAEFITYQTPIEEAIDLISDDCKLDEELTLNTNPKNEVYRDLGESITNIYNSYWKRIKGNAG